MTSQHILVIDDDIDTQTLLKDIFDIVGYTVTLCYNGREALELLETFQPDLILLDLMMPEMDGYTFLEAFQHHPSWYSSSPILVLTADVTAAKPLTQRGIEEYLLKPFHLESLLTSIAQHLAKRKREPHSLFCI